MTNQTHVGNIEHLHRLGAGIDALPQGFALFDENERLVFFNKLFLHTYDKLAAYIEPEQSWELILAEYRRHYDDGIFDAVEKFLGSTPRGRLIQEFRRADNRYVAVEVQPLPEGGFVLTELDTTENKKTSDLLSEANEQVQTVLDACSSRIALIGFDDGRILYSTPAWSQSFGKTDTIAGLIADSLEYSDFLTDLLAAGFIEDFELKLINSDGIEFPARLSGRAIDYHGESAAVLVAEDLTRLHKQQQLISRINTRTFESIEALEQGFAMYDQNQELIIANRHFRRINQPIQHLLRSGVQNKAIIEAAEQAGLNPFLVGCPSGEDSLNADDREVTDPQGNIFLAARRPNSDGGFVLAWRDVTEQRKLEQENRQQQELAFQNDKLTALGHLLAGVAHELNNPLAVIVGHSMMLREDTTDDETLEGLATISRAAERCTRVVKTFLAMARQKPLELTDCDLNDTIRMAVEVSEYSTRKNGIEIIYHPSVALPNMKIDEDQITQVLLNIILNADQAMHESGTGRRIEITTRHVPASGEVTVDICDDGPGIPETIKQRIFEPFFTTKAAGKGTGLGLALCERILNGHKGSITLLPSESGTTFRITLPSVSDSAASPTADSADRTDIARLKNAGVTVLIADDERDVAQMVAKLLATNEIKSQVANGGREALRCLEQSNNYDLILCDLHMPDIDGLAVRDIVYHRWPELSDRFVFMTGDALGDSVAQLHKEGTHRILEKPLNRDELLKVLGDTLAERKADVPATDTTTSISIGKT